MSNEELANLMTDCYMRGMIDANEIIKSTIFSLEKNYSYYRKKCNFILRKNWRLNNDRPHNKFTRNARRSLPHG